MNLFKNIIAGAALLVSMQAGAAVLSFEDLSSQSGLSGWYQNLEWTNFSIMDTSTVGPSGFIAAATNGANVAYNNYGEAALFRSDFKFDLISMDLTAAWQDGLLVAVLGYSQSTLLYESYFTLSTTEVSSLSLNYLGVDSIQLFTSTEGSTVLYPEYSGSGAEFAMDNVQVQNVVPVPEASTYGLCGAGALFGLAMIRRRKARSN